MRKTTYNLAEGQLTMRRAYDALDTVTREFRSALEDCGKLSARLEGGLLGNDARERAISLYTEYFLPLDQARVEMGMDPDEITLKARGVVGVSSSITPQIAAVNEARKAFEAALRKYRGSVQDPTRDFPIRLSRLIVDEEFGRRFCLRHVTRRIVHLEKRPDLISYTYARSRSVVHLTVQEAWELVKVKQRPFLESISPDTPLAQVVHGHGHWRANVTWRRRKQDRHQMFSTAIPILLTLADGDELPEIRHLDASESDDDDIRQMPRTKLADSPFIPETNIYRYRNAEIAKNILASESWKAHIGKLRKRGPSSNA